MKKFFRGTLLLLFLSGTAFARDGVYTPEEILAIARERNPSLAVYDANRRVAEAEVRKAGSPSNPEFEGLLGREEGRDGGDSGEVYGLSVVQPLELPVRRRTRVEAAKKGQEVVEAEERLLHLTMTADVRRSVYTVLHYQMLGEYTAETAKLAGEIENIAVRRLEGGESARGDAIKARVEALRAGRESRSLQRRLNASRAALNALCGGALPPDFKIDETDVFGALADVEDGGGLHPRLEVSQAIVRMREAEVERERAARWPEMKPGLGWERDPGSDTYEATLGIEVPIWSRGSSSISHAKAQLAQAEAAHVREEVELKFLREQAHETYMDAQEQVAAFEDGLRDAAEESLRAAMTLYEAGEVDFLEVLDARRTAQQTEVEYLMALYEAAVARVELEQLQPGL